MSEKEYENDVLRHENDFYREEINRLENELNELKTDVKKTVGIFYDFTQQFGVDFNNPESLSPAKLMPKVTIKVMTGGLNYDGLKELLPFYKKYNDLIDL